MTERWECVRECHSVNSGADGDLVRDLAITDGSKTLLDLEPRASCEVQSRVEQKDDGACSGFSGREGMWRSRSSSNP